MSTAEFDNYTLMLATLMAALMVGLGVTMIFHAVVLPTVHRLFGVAEAERRYLEVARRGLIIRNRVRGLQAEVHQLESQRSRLNKELQTLQRQFAAAATRPPDFIHEIGEPRAGQTKHVARVTVVSGSPLLKQASELYNPMWRHLNLAEVWASSPAEARQQLDLAYPDKLGYQKHFLDDQTTRAGDRVR
jgi:hypothetical protein